MKTCKVTLKHGTGEIIEKKSRFIANIYPVTSEEQAQAILLDVRKQFRDATHNCYAWAIGGNNEYTRCSDDGEPSGTAGRPILEVLTGEDIHNTLAVVTRYFGGTLLGTGGLVRAYTQAVKCGLENSKVVERCPGYQYEIRTGYNELGRLQYLAGQMDIPVLDIKYTETVCIELLVPEEEQDRLLKEVTEAVKGKAQITQLDKVYYGREASGKYFLIK